MKDSFQNKSVNILMASNYTYGPPMPSKDKKEWIEGELTNSIKNLENDFDVRCFIDCAQINENGEVKFNQEDWDKIYKFEFLDWLEQSGFATRDNKNFRLQEETKENLLSIIPSHYFEILEELFPNNETTFNATAEIDFYEQDLNRRVKHFADIAEDPNQTIIINCGGGNIGEKYMPQRLSKMREEFNPSPTVVFGFSDGTYMPFYFSDKTPNITLVQASNIFDLEYLKGERDVEIKLKEAQGSAPLSHDIEGNVLAISIHTSYSQIFDIKVVDQKVFDGKIVMLESARDNELDKKITDMINSGIFDHSKAIVLGKFNVKDQEEFNQEFTKKLNDRGVNIPVLQSADGPSVFGHGSGRREYIACGKCKITTDGNYIGENVVLAAQPREISPTEEVESEQKASHQTQSWVERVQNNSTNRTISAYQDSTQVGKSQVR